MTAAKIRLAFIFAAVAAILTQRDSRAAELWVGAGANYSRISLANVSGAATSIYGGMGPGAEVRLRLPHTGLDLFGFYSASATSNTNAAAGETNSVTGFGGGADLHLHRFFIGAQYHRISGTILSSVTNAPWNVGAYGARAGVSFSGKGRIAMMLGAAFEVGSAAVTVNGISGSSGIQTVSGFAQLQFRVH